MLPDEFYLWLAWLLEWIWDRQDDVCNYHDNEDVTGDRETRPHRQRNRLCDHEDNSSSLWSRCRTLHTHHDQRSSSYQDTHVLFQRITNGISSERQFLNHKCFEKRRRESANVENGWRRRFLRSTELCVLFNSDSQFSEQEYQDARKHTVSKTKVCSAI